jgi:TRAP-type mannitol/chloroaromatic compound transport system permease small subunit
MTEIQAKSESGKRASPLDRFASSFGHAVAALGVLGSLVIFGLAALIIYDVLSRELVNQAVAGVAEVVGMAVVAIVFLQIGEAVRAERLTRNHSMLNIILDKRPVIGHALEALFSLLGAVVFILIFATTIPYFMFALTSGQYFGGVMGVFVPVWPIKAITLIGSLAVSVQFALRMLKHVALAREAGSK